MLRTGSASMPTMVVKRCAPEEAAEDVLARGRKRGFTLQNKALHVRGLHGTTSSCVAAPSGYSGRTPRSGAGCHVRYMREIECWYPLAVGFVGAVAARTTMIMSCCYQEWSGRASSLFAP